LPIQNLLVADFLEGFCEYLVLLMNHDNGLVCEIPEIYQGIFLHVKTVHRLTRAIGNNDGQALMGNTAQHTFYQLQTFVPNRHDYGHLFLDFVQGFIRDLDNSRAPDRTVTLLQSGIQLKDSL
jgi:hypothetical protein